MDGEGTAAGSLGKYCSTTEITSGDLHNLLDAVSGEENADSDVKYRCFFILNNHATLTLTYTYAWLESEQAGGASIAISLDEERGKSLWQYQLPQQTR